MTTLLSIAASPDAPVACDLTDAADTLAERLAEYRRLFEHALVSRESTASETTIRLADRPGVREWLLDLVRREAACCPFLSYDVGVDHDEIVWVIRGTGAPDWVALDGLLDGAAGGAPAGASSAEIAGRLEARSGIPVIVPASEV